MPLRTVRCHDTCTKGGVIMSEPTDELSNEQWAAYVAGEAIPDARPLYDHCGCLFPCPDHRSPQQDAQRDRDYWNDL